MNTYFARHTQQLDVDDPWIERLWDERRVAIHYPEQRDGTLEAEDNCSINPTDHAPAGARAIRALQTLARTGGYVCAQYRGHEECLIGRVKERSAIEPMHAQWRQKSFPDGRVAALKTLSLEAVRIVDPIDLAVVLAGRPIRGTIMKWPNAHDSVECLVERRLLARRIDRLSPGQQEILCSEFLRLPTATKSGLPQLAQLLLPVGRTLKDLDILGLATDGRMLCAQVTYAPLREVQWKIDRLRAYSAGRAGAHLLLFCSGTEQHVTPEGVHIFPLDVAFMEFDNTREGGNWIDRAIGKLL